MATKTEQVIEGAKEIVANDKLQNAVAAMVNKSVAAFEAGADFLSEQIPDILHQLLLWHAVHSAMLCLAGLLILFIWIVLDVKIGRAALKLAKEEDDQSIFWVGYAILGSLLRPIPFLASVSLLNLTWLQIWIAPKVWLIEYAAKLVK